MYSCSISSIGCIAENNRYSRSALLNKLTPTLDELALWFLLSAIVWARIVMSSTVDWIDSEFQTVRYSSEDATTLSELDSLTQSSMPVSYTHLTLPTKRIV